jgi:4-hydroxybenzoyl-CoA thioesterase
VAADENGLMSTHKEIVYTARVEFGDCDPAGIVWFPNFFRWIDAASRHFFAELRRAALGRDHQDDGRDRHAAGRHAHALREAASYGDTLEIAVRITEWRDKSFVQTYRVTRGDDLILECEEVRIFAAKREGGGIRAVPIPPSIRALCEYEQAVDAAIDQVEGFDEGLLTAVPGVGHIALVVLGEVREQVHLVSGARRCEASQRGAMLRRHADDPVEALEVAATNLARAMRVHLDAAPARLGNRARIGRVAALLVGDRCAVDVDVSACETSLVQQERVRGGRPADIARTDEQNSGLDHRIESLLKGWNAGRGEIATARR